jgi:hypothetical protein
MRPHTPSVDHPAVHAIDVRGETDEAQRDDPVSDLAGRR